MREDLAELWRFRDLLVQIVSRELKVRYKNSVFGFLWSIVPPLLQVIVYTFAFRDVIGVQARSYGAYLLCGIIPWTFFSTAAMDSSQSLLIYYPIIRRIYLPRELVPIASVISNFIHFLLGWAVYFAAFAVALRLAGAGIPILPSLLWFPVITLIELLLVMGFSLWVSALNIFYEDVRYLLQTAFSLLFFLLPVLYPADNVYYSSHVRAHPWLFKLYMLNPIAAIITAYRKTILQPISPLAFNSHLRTARPLPMDWANFWESSLISLLIFLGGWWYFQKRKWQFVERP